LVNDSAKMELVELCNKSELKSREAYYLKKHANDPLLLSWAEYAWRPVLQYDLEGLFMKRHPSIGSAAKSNSFKLSKVQMVLSGIRKHHKGMVFAYESGGVLERVTQLEKKVRAVKIEQLTPAGEVIAIHDTYEVAAKNVKCSTKNIRRVLLGEQKTAAGFAWRYAM
jgi:hypothetical protein